MNRKPARRRAGQSGFTLVEIAMVLLIVGLVIGGMVTPLQTQLAQKRANDTARVLDEGREALYGYALRNGYLPCPAISPDNGLEARDGATCLRRYGYLPWATLSMARLDGWDRLMGYSVTPAFADSGTPFTLKTARDITVATRDAAGRLTPATAIADIPAIIISFGRNGYGATSGQNTRVADTGVGNADEKTNLQGGGTALIARQTSDDARAPGGAFDDMVVWISPNILFNRMVAAQRLP